jgi:hypothetical protein
MSKKNNFRSLLIVYICMVVFIVLIGVMGLIQCHKSLSGSGRGITELYMPILQPSFSV